MPELPDLQAFSRNLSKMIVGKKVSRVEVPNSKKLNVSLKDLKKALENQKIKSIYREGKELHISFTNGNVLGLHLMLRGQLHFFEEKNEKRYAIIELHFSDETGLAMSDFQGQATPTLNPAERDSPDALSADVNYKFLKEKLSRSKAAVKSLLLDQNQIRGIGNAYADEILWKAGISPFSVANKIPNSHIKKLDKAIKSVLKSAEKSILKANPDIISGEVRDFLGIHNAKRKESPTGGTIKTKAVGGRKTYFTEEQEYFK